MAKVSLHVYDVTNSSSVNANNAVVKLNRFMKDAINVGGIFHGAVEVYGEEWSYGFCERGSGVFSCPPRGNPMYTYRETIELGVTALSERSVSHMLLEASGEWDGRSYDLLARNCNHFCDEFCRKLGVGRIPPWINRLATAGDAAADFAGNTAVQMQKLQSTVVTAGRSAFRFLFGGANSVSPEPAGGSGAEVVPGGSSGRELRRSMGIESAEVAPGGGSGSGRELRRSMGIESAGRSLSSTPAGEAAKGASASASAREREEDSAAQPVPSWLQSSEGDAGGPGSSSSSREGTLRGGQRAFSLWRESVEGKGTGTGAGAGAGTRGDSLGFGKSFSLEGDEMRCAGGEESKD